MPIKNLFGKKRFHKFNHKSRNFLIFEIIGYFCLSFLYLFLFFSFKSKNHVFLPFTTAYSLLTLIVVMFSPYIIFIPLFYKIENNSVKIKIDKLTEIESFSILTILSFLYTISSTLIIQNFFILNFLMCFLIYYIIPVIIFFLKRKVIYLVFKKWLYILHKSNFHIYIGIIFVISLLIRFPIFIEGEIGVDTFLSNILSNRFIESGKIGYLLSPLSIFEYFPDSFIPSPIIYTANITILSNIPSYEAIYLISLFVGCFSSVSFYIFLNSPVMKRLLVKGSRNIIIITYIFLPLLLKYSDWFVSGRSIFFMLIPSILVLIFSCIFQEKFKIKIKLILWILIFFSLILSHGMGRILFIFAIIVLMTNYVFKKLNLEKIKNKKLFDFYLIIFGLILYLIPYILLYLGKNLLIPSSWMLRSSLAKSAINIFDNQVLIYFFGFLFEFGARLGFAALFFIIGMLLFPLTSPKPFSIIRILIFSIFIFFPFFSLAMYFYQALTPIIIIISGITIYHVIAFLKKKFIQNKHFFRKKKICNDKLKLVILIIFMLFSGILIEYMQYFRSKGEGNPITEDVLNLAEIFNQQEDMAIICSNQYLAYQLSAYSPNVISFPIDSVALLASYPNISEIIDIKINNIDLDLKGLIFLAINGLYISNTSTLTKKINILISGNLTYITNHFENFIQLNKKYKFKYFVYDRKDPFWPLLYYNILNGFANITYEVGDLEVYSINL
jgi:hypothetical protein